MVVGFLDCKDRLWLPKAAVDEFLFMQKTPGMCFGEVLKSPASVGVYCAPKAYSWVIPLRNTAR
jgi:hypothetical protein